MVSICYAVAMLMKVHQLEVKFLGDKHWKELFLRWRDITKSITRVLEVTIRTQWNPGGVREMLMFECERYISSCGFHLKYATVFQILVG